jgi:hypothetical protein
VVNSPLLHTARNEKSPVCLVTSEKHSLPDKKRAYAHSIICEFAHNNMRRTTKSGQWKQGIATSLRHVIHIPLRLSHCATPPSPSQLYVDTSATPSPHFAIELLVALLRAAPDWRSSPEDGHRSTSADSQLCMEGITAKCFLRGLTALLSCIEK